jgi:hypothetical protein
MAELETRAASWSKAAALAKSAVQKEELVAGLAQLSTAGSRRDHERAQQAAGLASRLEALEQHTATKGEVVTLVSAFHWQAGKTCMHLSSHGRSSDRAPLGL